ncbi:hypothetical protein PsYK624_135870 [Phanerochaete sordida]|uniref:BAG domain-containing protein n=1 Tax=Phanerochaete sordida TaxID=48140 RepID=A0A9P3GLU1_9APHY|nr:hypothetical protein PsYK624_135870 [Phanerochaete sordida]
MQLPADITPLHIAIPIAAILLGVALTSAKRLFSGQARHKMSYTVKWGRERLTFPLPAQNAPLSTIRKQIADYTQLPPNSFKLVYAGAVMKDDNAPISSYGIKENSKIAVIGGGENSVPSAKAAPERRTEENTIKQIQSELDKVRTTLQPDVDQFLSELQPTATATAAPPTPARKLVGASGTPLLDPAQEHVRLGEMLLQSLLRLDAINAEGEWEQARKERKLAVKEVQGLLDRLDLGWRQRLKSS